MSNQIVISSGAKVRSLEGVLTGTAGIVNSVPLGGANGVATLDSNGKVPLSQLPASVVTYLGTWNAATNTPTLANGTGDVGDLYICNVAGTVNFGAGPITFAVGDWVIYNGSEWQKSAGQNGTVTSVAVTSTGNDAISITGSPITTAGSINIGFTGTSAQYVNGAGDLTTFPTLTGFVPYTGATQDVDLGTYVLNAQALHVKGTAGAGHLGLKHQSAAATGSANESLIYANVDGDLAWQNDNLYLTTLSTHANTANRVYTFPDANGTIALTSNLTSYVPYTGATADVDLGVYKISSRSLITTGTTNGGVLLKQNSAITAEVDSQPYTSIKAFDTRYLYFDFGTATSYKRFRFDANGLTDGTTITYTMPNASGTLALTSDIPSLANYVTLNGAQTITGIKTFTNEQLFGNGMTLTGGYITYTSGSYNLTLNTNLLTANRNVFLQDGSGTLAFTSDIPSLSGYVQGSGTTSYHAKFTGTSTIGNSMLTDDGTTLQSIGATRSNLYLKAASTSYYSQLAFTNGSSAAFGGLSYNNAGQYMQFETNSSEWMRLTSDGKLGIGTTSASYLLDVNGTGRFTGNLSVTSTYGFSIGDVTSVQRIQYNSGIFSLLTSGNGYANINAAQFNFSVPANTNYGNFDALTNGYAYQAYKYSGSIYGYIGQQSAFVVGASGTDLGIVSVNNLIFNAGGLTERMRITSGGFVYYGTTSATNTALFAAKSSSASTIWSFGPNAANTNNIFRVENQDTTGVYLTTGNTSWTANSDERLKNITDNITNAVDNLMTLRTVKFEWKKDKSNKINLGLIAQDVIKVFPEVVDINDDEDKTLGVKYSELIPVLVKAIQEQQAQIEELKALINK